ncbi:sulfatase [Marinilabiliaceae bacterium JC017]|nr:sulfatase [Marinilabiliaceae bacterium JC017]
MGLLAIDLLTSRITANFKIKVMSLRIKNLIFGLSATMSMSMVAQERPNVLFIAVDDLKPLIGSYGHDYMITPNIDKLANSGVVFTNAHCQQAICGPSRASILTGMRPDYTGVWDLKTRMRDVNPDILALPEHFKGNGYTTVAVGKIYDPRCVDKQYDDQSWSIPYSESAKYTYPEPYGPPALSYYALEENKQIVHKLEEEGKAKGVKNMHGYITKQFKPSTECADVPDEAYIDGQICNNTLQYMKTLSQQKKPFFLAVGFKRPHLPFAAPKKYWDMYKRDEVHLAEYPHAVKDGVEMAYHKSGELYSYTDIPPLTSFSDIFTDNVPEDKQRELIHGYYASVSYVDAQVGKLMDQLKELGLDKNTVVVLWGDHGWHLGDHALWCKHTNFEHATRVPMIITTPSGEKGEYSHPAEFVDVFPTLCELTGIDTPTQLQGESLVPALENTNYKVKDYAVSQFGRGSNEGYSIRTDRYRLTLWLKDNYRTYMPFDEQRIVAGELYDYQEDPLETVNLYKSGKFKKVREQLMQYFKAFVKEQNQQLKNAGCNPDRTEKKGIKKSKTIQPVTNLSFGSDWETRWDVIARNGADAGFSVKDGRLLVNVKKPGKNPWDVAIALKGGLELQKGQTVQWKVAAKGGDIKMVLGPVNGQRLGSKIKPRKGKKASDVSFKIPASGVWKLKVQFLQAGTYEIGALQPVIE